MREGDKASFAQICLKEKAEQVTTKPTIDTLVIDGGWLLRQNDWGKDEKWTSIINGYVHLVTSLGYYAIHIVVVFDGYEKSTKDHTHRRRQKLFFSKDFALEPLTVLLKLSTTRKVLLIKFKTLELNFSSSSTEHQEHHYPRNASIASTSNLKSGYCAQRTYHQLRDLQNNIPSEHICSFTTGLLCKVCI